MSEPMSIVRREVGDAPVLELRGDLDFAAVPGLRGRLAREITAADGGIVLDLSAIPYLDSAGVHFLAELAEGLAAHRQQLWVALPPDSPIRRVVLFAGLEGMLRVADTVDGAVQGLSGG